MQRKGYTQGRFEKLAGKLLEIILFELIEKDEQVLVWMLMLLSVVVRSERKK